MRHHLVREVVRYYAERAGYLGPLRVTTRRAHFEELTRRRKVPLSASERYDTLAITLHGRTPVVWVAVDKHRTIADLARSAAHEAVHLRRGPGSRCGARGFAADVRTLVRGGAL
jgi:hypothetical protein